MIVDATPRVRIGWNLPQRWWWKDGVAPEGEWLTLAAQFGGVEGRRSRCRGKLYCRATQQLQSFAEVTMVLSGSLLSHSETRAFIYECNLHNNFEIVF